MNEAKVFEWLNKMVEDTKNSLELSNSLVKECGISAHAEDYVHLFGDHETLTQVAVALDKPIVRKDLDDHWEYSFLWKGMRCLWLVRKPAEPVEEEVATDAETD